MFTTSIVHDAQELTDFGIKNVGMMWLWVQARSEEIYDALRGCLPAKLVALFKIRHCSQDTMRWLVGV